MEEDTEILAFNFPAVDWEEQSNTETMDWTKNEKIMIDYLKGVKRLRVSANDMEWKETFDNFKVFRKNLVTKADGLPFTVCLYKLPIHKEVVEKAGYVVHSHPTLEICYIVEGKMKTYFEDVGVIETNEGSLVVQPPGLKHAAVSAEEETIVLALNIPPDEWEEK